MKVFADDPGMNWLEANQGVVEANLGKHALVDLTTGKLVAVSSSAEFIEKLAEVAGDDHELFITFFGL